MSRLLTSITLALLLCASASTAYAAGSAVGTLIDNSATVDYQVSGAPQQLTTTTNTVIVQELIDVVATWQDAASIQTSSPDSDQVLTFLIRNTGNGVESFALSIDNNPPGSDDFNPVNPRIHFDGNGNGSFDGPVLDPLYVAGNNDPVLDANAVDSAIIFVLNDIPVGSANGEVGDSLLQVDSLTAGAAGSPAATVLTGAGDGGVDAVVGSTEADADATGTYLIDNVQLDVAITKSATVFSDGLDCNTAPCDPIPGASIRYELQVDVTGIGTADNLVITDNIPTDTSYISDSIVLDTTPQTDISDADSGSFGAGVVTLDLGSVPGPATRVITFEVTID